MKEIWDHRPVIWPIAAALAFTLSGCQDRGGPRDGAQGGSGEAADLTLSPAEIRVAVGSDLRSTEPGVNRDAFTDDMINHVVEGLVAYKRDLTVGNALARSVTAAPDGLSYTFTLRPGATFHNGASVTASEVKWSIERVLRPDSGFLCKNWYDGSEGSRIVGVDAVDPATVRVRLDKPDGLFLTKLANFQCLMGVMHPSSVGSDGKWREPVGTGPYRIADWRKGQYVLMQRYEGYKPSAEPMDGYAGQRVPVARTIRWTVVPDSASARAALLSRQVDLIYNVDAADRDGLKADPRVRVLEREGLDWNALLFQTADPLLADRNLRLAIAHAVDVPRLAKAVTFGISKPNPSAIASTSSWFGDVQRQGYAFDPEKAKALLAQSAYRGQPLRITTNRRYQHMYDNALAIQSMLRKVGINAELDVTDWATQLSRYLAGDFTLMTFGFSARVDPTLAYMAFVGDKAKDGWVQWNSPAAQAQVNASSVRTDAAERRAIFDRLHKMQLADVPTLFLFNHYVIHATSKRLRGYEALSTNRVRLWNVAVSEPGGGDGR